MTGAITTGATTGGFLIYDTNTPGVIGPAVINSYTVLSIPAYWRAMNFISANMASFPRSITFKGVDTKHPLTQLISRRPNGYQNAFTFWKTLHFHRAHYGNGLAEIQRDSQYRPIALHNILPENAMPFRWIDNSGEIGTYYYVAGKTPHVVLFADMIHFAGLTYDGLGGINPIFLLAETFERARLTDRYMTRFLQRGSVIRGSIEIPAGATKEQQETIVNTLRQYFAGADAERDVIVLSEGAKLSNNTLSPEQSQLIEQTGYTTKQIAQITGVPPAFLYDLSEGKYNASVEEAGQMVVRDLFRPLIEADEDELSLKLLNDTEQAAGWEIHIDPNALIRGNTTTVSSVVTQQSNAGLISKNEGRAALGYPASNDPEADSLKTLGSTSPKIEPAPAEGEQK